VNVVLGKNTEALRILIENRLELSKITSF